MANTPLTTTMKPLIVIAAFCLLFTACYTYTQLPNSYYFNSFIGQTEHQILLQFGPPDRTITDGAGGKILDYRRSGDPVTTTGLYTDYFNRPYAVSTTQQAQWYLQFYVNSNNAVYSYRSNLPGPVQRQKVQRPQPHTPLFKGKDTIGR